MVPSLRTFISIWEKNGGSLQELIEAIAVVESLLKTYGNKLALPAVQEVLAKEHPDVASLISILHSLGKMDKKGLTSLRQMLAGSTVGEDLVVVKSSSPKTVDGLVAGAEVVAQEKIGLTVQGSNKIYKRTLDRDLNKVLT